MVSKIEGWLSVLRSGLAVRMQCKKVSELLIETFGGEMWYNGSHIITKIGDKFYDLDGQTSPDGHEPIENFGQTHLDLLDQGLETFNRWKIEESFEKKKYKYYICK